MPGRMGHREDRATVGARVVEAGALAALSIPGRLRASSLGDNERRQRARSHSATHLPIACVNSRGFDRMSSGRERNRKRGRTCLRPTVL